MVHFVSWAYPVLSLAVIALADVVITGEYFVSETAPWPAATA